MTSFKFDPQGSNTAARDYYDTHGYVVFGGLLPSALIDNVMSRYEAEIKPSKSKFFRQNTNHYEPNAINDHGYVRQSFLDIHAYESQPEFQEASLELYFSDAMKEALTAVTGAADHNLMQSMLFDLNAATPPHQDWWYLDSVPAGQLLAAWVAMEDIDERAGRFYVLPGSHTTALHEAGLPHSKWLERMREHLDRNADAVHAPAMKRGDVMFWNSRTIHGSYPTQDERFSRKSLTAHFLPAHLVFGNLFASKEWINYKEWRGNRYFANQPEYSVKADIVSRAKLAVYDSPSLLKIARKFQKKSLSEIK
jgi:phytanoyl-CoA hydroxylase